MDSPKHATALLKQGRWDEAMDTLLAAWRSHRAPELDDAVTALSDILAGGLTGVDLEDPQWQRVWERRAGQKRAAELGVLLPELTRRPKGGIPRRVRLALAYGPDPRVAAALIEVIEQPPITASANFSMWTELFAALPEFADERAIDRLELRAAERGGESQFWTKLEGWIAAVVPKLPATAELPEAWVAELAELEAQLRLLSNAPPQLEATPAPAQNWAEVSELGPAHAALEAGELADALDQLVGFWSQRRNPGVATMIDRLGGLVDVTLEPLVAPGKQALHVAWLEAAEGPQPHGVGRLLACLREGKLSEVEARIEAMTAWRPDPRVAQAMLMLTKDYMLGARDRLWKAVYEALLHHADPRLLDEVHARHTHLNEAGEFDRTRSERRAIRAVYAPYVELTEARHDLDIREDEYAGRIEALLAERVERGLGEHRAERALVEAIAADPDEDGPRLVYADWLQERNDPRGEFMALDLALAQGKRVRGKRDKYLKAHYSALLGPLERVTDWATNFERGLVDRMHFTAEKGGLDVGEDRRRETLEDLRWATVRNLRVGYADEGAIEIFEHAPLLALEKLSKPGLAALAGFARRKQPVPLRSLEMAGRESDSDREWAALGELAPVLPKLEHMEVMLWAREGGRLAPPQTYFSNELVRGLREIHSGSFRTGGFVPLDQWITRMVDGRCPVPLTQISSNYLELVLRQGELGRFNVDFNHGHYTGTARQAPELLLSCLRSLPRAHVGSVSIPRGGYVEAILSELEAALDGLQLEWLPSTGS